MSEKSSSNSALFYVLGSYGVPDNKTFVLFGSVKSGEVRSGMYAKIALNSSLNLSVKIDEVTRIEVPNDKSIDTLLVIYNDHDTTFYDFLFSMNVELETIQIDEDGTD